LTTNSSQDVSNCPGGSREALHSPAADGPPNPRLRCHLRRRRGTSPGPVYSYCQSLLEVAGPGWPGHDCERAGKFAADRGEQFGQAPPPMSLCDSARHRRAGAGWDHHRALVGERPCKRTRDAACHLLRAPKVCGITCGGSALGTYETSLSHRIRALMLERGCLVPPSSPCGVPANASTSTHLPPSRGHASRFFARPFPGEVPSARLRRSFALWSVNPGRQSD
jgi:hypothetical protein